MLFGVHFAVFHGEVGAHGDDGVFGEAEHVMEFVAEFVGEGDALVVAAHDGFGEVEDGVGDAFNLGDDFEHGTHALGVLGGEAGFGDFGEIVGDFDFDLVALVLHELQFVEISLFVFAFWAYRSIGAFCGTWRGCSGHRG